MLQNLKEPTVFSCNFKNASLEDVLMVLTALDIQFELNEDLRDPALVQAIHQLERKGVLSVVVQESDPEPATK